MARRQFGNKRAPLDGEVARHLCGLGKRINRRFNTCLTSHFQVCPNRGSQSFLKMRARLAAAQAQAEILHGHRTMGAVKRVQFRFIEAMNNPGWCPGVNLGPVSDELQLLPCDVGLA